MSKLTADNFIEEFIVEDLENGKHDGRIHTRFPPEPNGYLHIGHAKAIVINFEIGKKFGGKTNLRMDDTNPTTEETHFVDNIANDIKWLGYEWEGDIRYASDYFGELYQMAHNLIDKGLAYVDDSTADEIAEQKGDIDQPGTNSPYRGRSVEENKRLFTEMKEGKYPDGKVLRAKIDMAHPNLLLRDPVLYRIKHETHHRTGDDWCIYPLYDFAHGQSDSIEHITHSLCSLEFRHHRDLYNWLIEALEIFPSRQIEFARMNVDYLITSKRRLKKLVEEGIVAGWDDPRMGTLAGMRRKGYPAAAIRNFCMRTGVTKRDNQQEFDFLEHCVREVLNETADRYMAVLDPVKLVITNYPEGESETLPPMDNNPEDESRGSRQLSFGRELWVERGDYRKEPQNRKYFRMAPEKDVRLKGAYILNITGHDEDADGNVTQINATYYPDSRSGSDTSGVKAKGTLHWVNAADAIDIEVREYAKLFTDPTPMDHEDKDFMDFINPDSLKVITAKGEPALAQAPLGATFQFLRKGYYTVDPDSAAGSMVFNATCGLKSSWKG